MTEPLAATVARAAAIMRSRFSLVRGNRPKPPASAAQCKVEPIRCNPRPPVTVRISYMSFDAVRYSRTSRHPLREPRPCYLAVRDLLHDFGHGCAGRRHASDRFGPVHHGMGTGLRRPAASVPCGLGASVRPVQAEFPGTRSCIRAWGCVGSKACSGWSGSIAYGAGCSASPSWSRWSGSGYGAACRVRSGPG